MNIALTSNSMGGWLLPLRDMREKVEGAKITVA